MFTSPQNPIRPAFENGTVFIDWNSQLIATRLHSHDDQGFATRKTLTWVAKRICKAITQIDDSKRFTLTLRVYHGWYRGYSATKRRDIFQGLQSELDFSSLSTSPNIQFRPKIEFGDQLLSAESTRLFPALSCHLPNTYRKEIRGLGNEEKMVDTALASDLLDAAFRDKQMWLIVVGEDDDLVPPIFVAEAARDTPGAAPTILIRSRPSTKFLKLEGLQCKL